MDGLKFIKEIRKKDPNKTIIIVSAYIEDTEWRHKLEKELAHDKHITEFHKPLGPEHFKLIKEKLINPFTISLNDYIKMPYEKKYKLIDIAYQKNKDIINKYFEENTDKDWIIIAHEIGNIIASGSFDNEPYGEELEKLAEKENAPVFTYSRPVIIEQINWSYKGTDDYYPTLHLKCNEKVIIGDFDTGSFTSFISENDCYSENSKNRYGLYTKSSAWNNTYEYIREKLNCYVQGKTKRQDIIFDCRIVRQWKNSIFWKNYEGRLALFGRNILNQNKITLILDSTNKETDII
jgi:hypothetical protein